MIHLASIDYRQRARKILSAFCCVIAAGHLHAAFNFEISDVQTQIAGTSTDVPGSGSSDNFDSGTTVGDFAVFDIDAVDDSNGTRSDFADLRVTYASDNGGAGSNVMIARTSDSQGLTDNGTLSVLMDLGSSSGGTVGLEFDWFSPGSFDGGVEQPNSSLLSTRIRYTTFDIDFNQVVTARKSEISTYVLEGTTELTATDDGTNIRFEDAGADSTFDDPTTAAQVLTRDSIASHTFETGKQAEGGAALFMFEFRDPSDVVSFEDPQSTEVPEPGMAALAAGVFASAAVLLRRRPRGVGNGRRTIGSV